MEQDHFVRSGYDVSYTQSPNTKPIYILLMTYMRGGSSFLGEMFNQNPKVFYWFEPLAETFKKIMGMIDSRNWFLHDDLSLRWFSPRKKKTIFKLLSSIFSCKIDALPEYVLKHNFATNMFWNKSLSLNSYRECLEAKPNVTCRSFGQESHNPSVGRLKRILCSKDRHFGIRPRNIDLELSNTGLHRELKSLLDKLFHQRSSLYYTDDHLSRKLLPLENSSKDIQPYRGYLNTKVRRCSANILTVCKQRPIHVIKTVRMRMDLVLQLLNAIPELKVVYEWRNPLGILNSRWSSSKYHRISNFTLDTDILCKQMNFDLVTSDRLKAKFPNSMTVIKYEDLADNTIGSVSGLYGDLGIGSIPDSIFSWIVDNTKAETTSGPLSTKKNATAVVRQWKSQLDKTIINYIKDKCRDVLKLMNYDDELLL
ncbi:hypothetical protein LSH36_38g01005 [Paralvinella palmiformis]|uniref:Sulfotransferase domain-containing protein n=1 Tax=Paralvinella palmiformis TaxID=53620 RepID=A0AAD9NDQ9_9ANNE|nr:hypothetical protein LSH36_38g01005 [Paralvinella palmiformis]